MWLEHPSFKENIASRWKVQVHGRWEGLRIMEKLRKTKGKFKVWNKEVFSDIQTKKEIVVRIDEIDTFESECPLDSGLIEDV